MRTLLCPLELVEGTFQSRAAHNRPLPPKNLIRPPSPQYSFDCEGAGGILRVLTKSMNAKVEEVFGRAA